MNRALEWNLEIHCRLTLQKYLTTDCKSAFSKFVLFYCITNAYSFDYILVGLFPRAGLSSTISPCQDRPIFRGSQHTYGVWCGTRKPTSLLLSRITWSDTVSILKLRRISLNAILMISSHLVQRRERALLWSYWMRYCKTENPIKIKELPADYLKLLSVDQSNKNQ